MGYSSSISEYAYQPVSQDSHEEELHHQVSNDRRKAGLSEAFTKASFVSRFTFRWLDPLLKKGKKHRIANDDLALPVTEEADNCYLNFMEYWSKELKRPDPKLLRAIWNTFYHDIAIAGLYKLFWGFGLVTAAYYWVKELVEFVRNNDDDHDDDHEDDVYHENRGYFLSLGFFLTCWLLSAFLQQMAAKSSQVGIRVRAAIVTAVYRKALRVDGVSTQVGDVVTLVSADCSRLHEGCTNIHYLWSAPIECIVLVGLLFFTTGVSAVVGVGVILISLPLQYSIAQGITQTRVKNIEAQDHRVQVMQEILHAIKLVKFYAWEEPFAKTVREIREMEISYLMRVAVLKSLNLTLVYVMPPMILVGVFALYVKWQDELLDSAVAFVALSLLNSLRFPLIQLPVAIKNAMDTLAALRRIQHFLMLKEVDIHPSAPDVRIRLNDCSFYYPRFDPRVALANVTLHLKPGEVLAVVGSVGCGKTTLLNGILREAQLYSGTMSVGGKKAYVSQLPWIQQCSVRDNILFGKPMDEDRYNQVVYACALERDMSILEFGDLTEIGEGGINMSGGQKQRIALARAVYADADIYLLDSPLSAVDNFTCNHIFEKCIRGVLSEKAVILVTHQLHLLPEFDQILVLQDGHAKYCGPYYDTLISQYFPSAVVTTEHQGGGATGQHPHHTKPEDVRPRHNSISNKAPRMSFEVKRQKEWEAQRLAKPWFATNPYALWMKHATFFGSFISLIVVVGTQTIRIFSDMYIQRWTKDQPDDEDDPEQVDDVMDNQNTYIATYGIYIGAFFIATIFRGILFFMFNLRAATKMHNRMFKAVLRAPMQFFTVTPLGVLLNCFSKQQDQVDETLADATHVLCIYIMQVILAILVVVLIVPMFALVGLVLLAAFLWLHFYYADTANFIKERIAGTNPSIFSHVSESVAGIDVIRAFGMEAWFCENNLKRVNENHSALFCMEQLQCWVAFRLDTMASLMVLATALFCVRELKGEDDSGSAGLAISTSLQMLVFLTMLVRAYTDMRSQISAVESITHYAQTPSEKQGREVDLPFDWPQHGQIEILDLGMRYADEMPLVIKHVTLTIYPREKVGIIGRTGSGKSSLLMALFRLIEPAFGTIKIDGIDIRKCDLTDLRRKLSIIPQQPVMFKGTLRSNLDPFDKHTDDELWQALERSHLAHYARQLPKQLNFAVTENGQNMSLGHKQLVCLARAILNDSKILVLDEATSALDLETDALIQQTVRTVFADKTVLTIAHRLETLMDYDKILFLDAGQVLEYDSRETLLKNKKSHFYQLVHGIGDEPDLDDVNHGDGAKFETLSMASSSNSSSGASSPH